MLVNKNIYWYKRLNWAFFMHMFAKIFIYRKNEAKH